MTYDVAESSYYNGEEFAFYVDKTCGAAPTLNINGLGAMNIRKFSGGSFVNLVAGDIVANQPLRVAYNGTATTTSETSRRITAMKQIVNTMS